MGIRTSQICKRCGSHFTPNEGGGFRFDLLHCELCGRDWSIGHEEIGDAHLRYVKGLRVPYAISRMKFDRWVQANYPGEPLTEAEYHAAVEAMAEPCACGGRFRYDAPARCPTCSSTSEQWERDPTGMTAYYD
jgi:hypothetical protein